MPYNIEYEETGVYVCFTGDCTYKEILDATIMLWENPKFEKIQYEIFDYLGVTSIDISEYDAVELAVRDRVASKMTRRNKIAVVATLPEILVHSETYGKTLEAAKVAQFVTESLSEAREWVLRSD